MKSYIAKIPKVIGKWKIDDRFATGSFSFIHRITNTQTGQLCCVKIIPKDFIQGSEEQQRIRNEIRALGMVTHPNIAKIVDSQEDTYFRYIIMDYFSGDSLAQLISLNMVPNSPKFLLTFFSELMSEISHLHEIGICHLGIYPENIIITDKNTIRLVDLGHCQFFRPNINLDSFNGPLAYTPPECIVFQPYAGPAVDIWQAGICLYFLLYCQYPWAANSTPRAISDIIAKANFSFPTSRALLLTDILKSILVLNPSQRPNSNDLYSTLSNVDEEQLAMPLTMNPCPNSEYQPSVASPTPIRRVIKSSIVAPLCYRRNNLSTINPDNQNTFNDSSTQ